MPTGRKWPLLDLIDACRYYIDKLDRREFLEDAAIISTLTATWWGVTMKTDAVAHAREAEHDAMLKDSEGSLPGYHYAT